jgi:ATP-dependent DNA ligase
MTNCAPEQAQYAFEPKWDGMPALRGGTVSLQSRNNLDQTPAFLNC